MTKSIHQEIKFSAKADKIYELILSGKFAGEMGCDEKTAKAPTANKAGSDAGQTFCLFGGMIEGRNIELVPGQRIVQAWRPKNWETGVYSLVKFELKQQEGKTQVVFDQVGFPDDQFDHLSAGWQKNYWDAIKKLVE
jgi:activator of HSP90 ATPase